LNSQKLIHGKFTRRRKRPVCHHGKDNPFHTYPVWLGFCPARAASRAGLKTSCRICGPLKK